MKMAITGDLHLNNNTYNIKDKESGLPIKTVDSFKALDFFVDECISHQVDRAVLVGDIYDNHFPGNCIMEMFNHRIQKLSKNGVQVVIMPGNHDFSGKHHAIKTVKGWRSNIQVVDSPFVETGNGYMAIYVPHTAEIESGVKTFPQIVADMRPSVVAGQPVLFFGHMSVNGAMRNDSSKHASKTDVSVGDIEATGATHVFLAHFHKHQRVGDGIPAHYVGSIERHRLDEINGDRGFYIFDTETLATDRVEYTGHRPMKKMYVESFDEALEDITHEDSWAGHIVRIEFEGGEKEYAKIKSNFKELRAEFERRGGVVLKLADVKYTKEEDDGESTALSVDDLDLINMFDRRLEDDFPDDEDERKKLRTLFSEIYKKAEATK